MVIASTFDFIFFDGGRSLLRSIKGVRNFVVEDFVWWYSWSSPKIIGDINWLEWHCQHSVLSMSFSIASSTHFIRSYIFIESHSDFNSFWKMRTQFVVSFFFLTHLGVIIIILHISMPPFNLVSPTRQNILRWNPFHIRLNKNLAYMSTKYSLKLK